MLQGANRQGEEGASAADTFVLHPTTARLTHTAPLPAELQGAAIRTAPSRRLRATCPETEGKVRSKGKGRALDAVAALGDARLADDGDVDGVVQRLTELRVRVAILRGQARQRVVLVALVVVALRIVGPNRRLENEMLKTSSGARPASGWSSSPSSSWHCDLCEEITKHQAGCWDI